MSATVPGSEDLVSQVFRVEWFAVFQVGVGVRRAVFEPKKPRIRCTVKPPTMTTTRMTSGIQVRISTLKISDPLHRLAVVRRTIPNFQNPFELVAT